MIVIIAGSRTIKPSVDTFDILSDAIVASGFDVTEVVGGEARGVDRIGKEWAKFHRIPFKPFPATWRDREGVLNRGAGFARNEDMAVYAATECLDGGGLVALMYEDEPTEGTTDMIERAYAHELLVHIHLIPSEL